LYYPAKLLLYVNTCEACSPDTRRASARTHHDVLVILDGIRDRMSELTLAYLEALSAQYLLITVLVLS